MISAILRPKLLSENIQREKKNDAKLIDCKLIMGRMVVAREHKHEYGFFMVFTLNE